MDALKRDEDKIRLRMSLNTPSSSKREGAGQPKETLTPTKRKMR
jgi:hypothetical protein